MLMPRILSVTGMTSDDCVEHVRAALKAIPEVTSAVVSLDAAEAVVSVSGEIDDARLIAAVKEAGYDATLD
jgi:copper chaperone